MGGLCVRAVSSGGRSYQTCYVEEPPTLYGYRPYCTRQLEYQVQIPTSEAPAGGWPLVIFIHGGGWTAKMARRAAFWGNVPKPLGDAVDAGKCALAVISYRLTSEAGEWGQETPVTWPAQYEDVLEQVQHIVTKAGEYNLDPARFGLWGASAGAYLAVMLATRGVKEKNLPIKACVDIFGPIAFADHLPDIGKDPAKLQGPWETRFGTEVMEPWGTEIMDNLMGFPISESNKPEHVEALASANPLKHFSRNMPPIFIAHGDNDPVIPTKQSVRLHEALQKARCVSQLHIVPGGSHEGIIVKAHGEVCTSMPNKEAFDFLMLHLLK